MAWWQKKLLRYALARTGLLDDAAIDLEQLDITLGKKNVVELKDVGLNVGRLAKLAQLPPELRIETARVISLRLIIPADIYHRSIVAEIDGLEVNVRLDSQEESPTSKRDINPSSPVVARTPPHRKVHRRIQRLPSYDPGGFPDDGHDDARMLTTAELAKSFVFDEPLQRRRELEASIAASERNLGASTISESSNGPEVGIGAGIGLPKFLADFLEGVLDRLQVVVRNLRIRVETTVSGDGLHTVPVALVVKIGVAELGSSSSVLHDGSNADSNDAMSRTVKLKDLSVHLISEATMPSELSFVPLQIPPNANQQHDSVSESDSLLLSRQTSPLLTRNPKISIHRPTQSSGDARARESREGLAVSVEDLLFTGNERKPRGDVKGGKLDKAQCDEQDLDIRPGDDNVSWGSRRSKSHTIPEDLWSSMTSNDDLSESLFIGRRPSPPIDDVEVPRPVAAKRDRPRLQARQSQGSWPGLDDSPQPRRSHQSPGSWPTMEQSHQSLNELFPPTSPPLLDEHVDNKMTALETSTADLEMFDTPPEPSLEVAESLATSRLFTHEDAESMYLSAMAPTSRMHIPGGWSQDNDESDGAIAHSRYDEVEVPPAIPHPTMSDPGDGLSTQGEGLNNSYGHATPRPGSPELDPMSDMHNTQAIDLVSRQLLSIDLISLSVPVPRKNPELDTTDTQPDLPGAFSMSAAAAASRHQSARSHSQHDSSVLPPLPADIQRDATPLSLRIALGSVRAQIDVVTGRMLYKLSTKASGFVAGLHDSQYDRMPEPESRRGMVILDIQDIVFAVKDSTTQDIGVREEPSIAASLATLRWQDMHLKTDSTKHDLSIASFNISIGSSQLLTFDRTDNPGSSITVDDQTPSVVISASKREGLRGRAVMELKFETLPIEFLLDLSALQNSFETFGGLSGVLELGNSILSESARTTPPLSPERTAKGVRFEADADQDKLGTELKVNGRIAGFRGTLRARTCSAEITTSSIKIVHREYGTRASVANVVMTGPQLIDHDVSAPSLALSTLNLDFLAVPANEDLERLLSLLTPSKDKYDNDDDILLDTLFRQRKKGTVMRLTIGLAEFACKDWTWASALSALEQDLVKLSAVTKYLPEDERPGLLSLIRLKQISAHLPTNDRLGILHVSATDFHCAHVGLPALVALSLSNVNVTRPNGHALIRPLVPRSGSDNLPMLMARMLGDEEEPTIKIKLFNTCSEYSVPVLLAVRTSEGDLDAERIIVDMSKSMSGLLNRGSVRSEDNEVAKTGSPVKPSQSKRIEVLLHDSALGLSPSTSSAKAMLVLADAQLSTIVPARQDLDIGLLFRKVNLFVTDDIAFEAGKATATFHAGASNEYAKLTIAAALTSQGFVPVGSIMGARVNVHVTGLGDAASQCVAVEVTNELLLLETCADSTQTLLAIFTGLAPPRPPSKQPKYLTQPMTIEDMMASFTGDALEKPKISQLPETLFDIEEEEDEDAFMHSTSNLRHHDYGDDDDDLLAESEMTDSLYGPVSGILGEQAEMEDHDDENDLSGAVASLLEDDPFEMTLFPAETRLSDAALARELGKQGRPTTNSRTVDLGVLEIDSKEKVLPNGPPRLTSPLERPNTDVQEELHGTGAHPVPFGLKLRDGHIIWNVYDGYDWRRTRDGITQAVEQVEIKAEERKMRQRQQVNERDDHAPIIGDCLFNSIYIGVPSNQDAQDLRRQINRNIDDLASDTESIPVSGMSRPTTAHSPSGRPVRERARRRLKLERSKVHKISFELKGIFADVLVFPEDHPEFVSSVDVRVKDFEVFDHVRTSTWHKFLTHLHEPAAREMSKPMLHLELFTMRTLERFTASEIALHVGVLPLRLHVDQDALDFITRFFEFKDDRVGTDTAAAEQPFLQRVEVDTVNLCLDYKPKTVDYAGLRSGHTTEFMNFIILEAANIRLNHAIIYGITGFEPLHKTLNDIWMPDVKRNQLPTVLAGLAPVRSLVNIGTGVRDVLAIPIREYRKDGRIVRSVQKGAFSFGKTTTSELARLGAKVAMGTQTLLQGTEGLLTPASASPGRSGPSRGYTSEPGLHDVDQSNDDEHEPRSISAYADQPFGVLSGLRSAQRYLEYDLLTARDALIAVQGEIFDNPSAAGAATAVVKHAPTVILRPIIGTSRALATALLGAANQIDRDNLRRVEDVSVTSRSDISAC